MAVYNVVSQPNALDMSDWHTCETTHSRAGWVVHLAGEKGYALEKYFGSAALAAQLIYKQSGYEIHPGKFYESNEQAMEDIRALAEAKK